LPLDASLVGVTGGEWSTVVDARWLMAYAAGIPDEHPSLFDTESLVMHPLFPVAPEWNALVATSVTPAAMPADEVSRGVHVAHDLLIGRPAVAGEVVRVGTRVVSVDRHRAGAVQTVLVETRDASDALMWRTLFTSLFLGVELDGEPEEIGFDWPERPVPPDGDVVPIAVRSSSVSPVAAHVYSECARIWNPIHTDASAARAAGLDAPILHGTATLARAVTAVAELTDTQHADIGRISCRFGAMVALDSEIEVRLIHSEARRHHFDVVTAGGQHAIVDGYLESFGVDAARPLHEGDE